MGVHTEFASMIAGVLRIKDWSVIPAISQAAGAVLFAAIWQSAVLAACLAGYVRLVPRANATHRFIIWASGFAVALCLPFLHLFSRLSASAGSLAPEAVKPLLHVDLRWSIAITVVWAMASLYRAIDLAIHSLRLRGLWKSAKPAAIATGYAAMLEIPRRRTVEICTTNQLERPSVIGFLAPRILIPEWLFARLTPGELDQIVLHETEHLRRGDDWTNLLQKVSLILFPLNPVLLWMERRLCLEREMACDEGVVRVTRAPRAYAACLTSLAERGVQRRSEALSLGVWQRRPELVHRIHSILARRTALGPIGARSLMAVLGCGLLFGSAELSRCPQLIAFTSTPITASAEARAEHMPAIGISTKPRMQNVSYSLSTLENQAMHAYTTPHMTELKAILPVHTGSPFIAGTRTRKSSVAKAIFIPQPVTFASGQASPGLTAYNAWQETIKPSETETVASADAMQDQPQSWIVLTTWEVVTAPAQNSSLISDQIAEDSSISGATQNDPSHAEPAANTLGQHSVPTAGQIRVTQLVFRILPSRSDSSVEAPIRASWLVIQL
jgi:beta-lactamase regulating signal transducer with metallopeptidase domain